MNIKLSPNNGDHGDLLFSARFAVPVFVLGPDLAYYGMEFAKSKIQFNRPFSDTNSLLNGNTSIRKSAKALLEKCFGL